MGENEMREQFKGEMEGDALLTDIEQCKDIATRIYDGYAALPPELQARVEASYAAMEQAVKDKKSMSEILGFAAKALSLVKIIL